MNENNTIKDLEAQAKNTKHLMDALNSAYLGLTIEEIIKLALKGKGGGNDRNDDNGSGRREA